ncbi:MBL fold metallo-hydrolase [Niallia nealsonii]|uniref:Ribonuclease Z n=1 Tax=Niallia nealsonii TaxID=115979 RepID=A0A2N0Z1C3_9BACI|nr:MBL fold metallo-hydrolase [Niallia nealsonii]PKG23316.1 ribonuclease Z [Niallia nealsonii]
MLNFIGCGSAFNTALGNNGAFIKKDHVLFLIDCGSSTFARLQKTNLLEGIEEICILLTHTHCDHIGSLGDLILYGYYSMNKLAEANVCVYAPNDLNIKPLLRMMGVEEHTYKLIEFSELTEYQYADFHIDFEPIKVPHVKELKSYGYIIHYDNKTIYYSGDCNEIPANILNRQNNGGFDLFYQDTCIAEYEGNVHLSLKKLDKLMDAKAREKVYCMHLDNGFNEEDAKKLGFNVVAPII